MEALVIRFADLKKFCLFLFIGSLIAASAVAVVTVLSGDFSQVTMKVFMTLLLVVLHALVSLLFIWDDERRNTFHTLAFFTNVVFLLIVCSFIISLFTNWDLMSSKTMWHCYQSFFYVGFAALHADMLSKAMKKEAYMDAIIVANYVLIVMVLGLLLPIVFLENSVFGDFYFRALGALAIVDGTLSILTMIFYKLYLHNHPKEKDVILGDAPKPVKRGFGGWLLILFLYLGFQLLFSLSWVLGTMWQW